MSAIITNKTFEFLNKLKKNNNREWFNENKNLYTEAQSDVLNFIESLISEIGKYDENLLKMDAKKSMFRIYRDTRFSKDKIPYKTNFGASLGMGKGNQKGGYYFHLEPGKSFIAGGIYMPEPSTLKAVRKEISLYGDDFLTILNDKKFKKLFSGLSEDDKLKKIPQGFEKEDPMGEFLKLKSFIVVYNLKDEEIINKNAAANLSKIFEVMKPLNAFLNRALDS
ncbi:DUF2461 domain-containing protein [Chryseobacterium sp. JAH]|uniref:DUF2461 domain-containing protein n=1 Tax=Chryseobacterium sp. JAH TaxID=1742858 RepID=UPI0009E6A13E|nr:DUF2461 domain-containing protein [Chryseobacterium sp. JAH]